MCGYILEVGECCILFLGHCDIDPWPEFLENCVLSISSILFEVGTPNLLCGYIFGSRNIILFLGHLDLCPHFWKKSSKWSVRHCQISFPKCVACQTHSILASTFFEKFFQEYHQSVNRLDPYQVKCFVWPDLGPNYLGTH